MDKLKNMRVFCRIVELGTFTAVAREVGVSAMMISKYMRALENELGVSLISRKTRKSSVTEIGGQYYQQCKRLLNDLDDVESSITQSGELVRGLLRINVPIDFGGLYMVPVINAYQNEFPEVEVSMTLNNEVSDLHSGQVDIAIVVTDRLDPDVVARKIAQTSLCTYASPIYIEKYGCPKTPHNLHQHKCLHYVNTPHADAWIFNGGNERIDIHPKWVFASNNGGALCQAAALGMGIVRSPALSVSRYVETGDLVEILSEYKLSDLSVYATYLQHHYYPAKVSTFLDFLTHYFSK